MQLKLVLITQQYQILQKALAFCHATYTILPHTTDSALARHIKIHHLARTGGYTMLESSAGYYNDRTAYSDDTTSTALTTIVSYKTDSADMYFGAYGRNYNATNAGKTPSLTCPRSVVDLYHYVAGGTSVANELKYPATLLTADELSFAGSGNSTASKGSTFNAKSFLHSGQYFWLLSPNCRRSGGAGVEFGLEYSGYFGDSGVDNALGVRPAISLNHGTTVAGGKGTAEEPWTINE